MSSSIYQKEYQKRYREKLKEWARLNPKKWREFRAALTEARRQYFKDYYAANREKIRAQQKALYAKKRLAKLAESE